MKVGAIFPQTECGTDVKAIGEFARVVEAMGFDHLFVADHVLGLDPKLRAGGDRISRSSVVLSFMVGWVSPNSDDPEVGTRAAHPRRSMGGARVVTPGGARDR